MDEREILQRLEENDDETLIEEYGEEAVLDVLLRTGLCLSIERLRMYRRALQEHLGRITDPALLKELLALRIPLTDSHGFSLTENILLNGTRERFYETEQLLETNEKLLINLPIREWVRRDSMSKYRESKYITWLVGSKQERSSKR
jgi:hypothetical protein